jgi:hypothetical protein
MLSRILNKLNLKELNWKKKEIEWKKIKVELLHDSIIQPWLFK